MCPVFSSWGTNIFLNQKRGTEKFGNHWSSALFLKDWIVTLRWITRDLFPIMSIDLGRSSSSVYNLQLSFGKFYIDGGKIHKMATQELAMDLLSMQQCKQKSIFLVDSPAPMMRPGAESLVCTVPET